MKGIFYRCGGLRHSTNTNDRAIIRVATSFPTTSLESVRSYLPPSGHPVVSRETIRKRLAADKKRRRLLRRIQLTSPSHHSQYRFDFCRPRES
ncbi:hypothetical protein TNCV_1202351 [Trichonephila clavipes]|nr:hypothetical protein TNCV_1202351 [Trichonephila clavipes]